MLAAVAGSQHQVEGPDDVAVVGIGEPDVEERLVWPFVGKALGIRLQSRVAIIVPALGRSEEHTSELQSLMRISYAVFCLKKKKTDTCTTRHKYIDHSYTNKHRVSENDSHTQPASNNC